MRIGIDLDDTLVATKDLQEICWRKYLTEKPCDRFTFELPPNINHFGDPVINEFWDEYREYLAYPEFIKGAVSSTNKLKQEGHELIIVTLRAEAKYNNLRAKLYMMFDEYNVPIDEIILDARDKGRVLLENNIDVLIDDDPIHVISAISYEKRGILFNDIKGFAGLKTNDWDEIPKIIKELENTKTRKKTL